MLYLNLYAKKFQKKDRYSKDIKRYSRSGTSIESSSIMFKVTHIFIEICPFHWRFEIEEDIPFFRTPTLDEQLIVDIANFYIEFLVYYHVTLESELNTQAIDILFEEFYIQHQDVIRSKQLIFYLENPNYVNFKPLIFINIKYYFGLF